jgi:hypothetical protein
MSGNRQIDLRRFGRLSLRLVNGTTFAPTATVVATTDRARYHTLLEETAMLEEPCIIQMNIDRYRAMLSRRQGEKQRAHIERLLADANRQLTEAIHQLAQAIDTANQDQAVDQARPYGARDTPRL